MSLAMHKLLLGLILVFSSLAYGSLREPVLDQSQYTSPYLQKLEHIDTFSEIIKLYHTAEKEGETQESLEIIVKRGVKLASQEEDFQQLNEILTQESYQKLRHELLPQLILKTKPFSLMVQFFEGFTEADLRCYNDELCQRLQMHAERPTEYLLGYDVFHYYNLRNVLEYSKREALQKCHKSRDFFELAIELFRHEKMDFEYIQQVWEQGSLAIKSISEALEAIGFLKRSGYSDQANILLNKAHNYINSIDSGFELFDYFLKENQDVRVIIEELKNQVKTSHDSIYIAKKLIERGRNTEARDFWERAIRCTASPFAKAKILFAIRNDPTLYQETLIQLQNEVQSFNQLIDLTAYLYQHHLKEEAEIFYQRLEGFIEEAVEEAIEEERQEGQEVCASDIELLRFTKSLESAHSFMEKDAFEVSRRILHQELFQASRRGKDNFLEAFRTMKIWNVGKDAADIIRKNFPLRYLRDLGWDCYQKAMTHFHPQEEGYRKCKEESNYWYELVLQKAEQGSIEDKREVAYWYSQGEPERFLKDTKKAQRLYKMLENQASQGSFIELRDYAYWCFNGEKVPRDIKKAKKYYNKMHKRLKKLGTMEDYYKVIQWYKTGRNMTQDMSDKKRYQECKKLYDELVKKDPRLRNKDYRAFRYARGDSTRFITGEFLDNVEQAYLRPQDNSIDISKAYIMYKEAQHKKAKRLNEDKILNLAYFSESSDPDVDFLAGLICHFRRAYTKAFEYYKRAADQDHKDACYTLAEFYTENNVNDVLDVSAEECAKQNYLYMKRAAELGHPDAPYFLGGIYYLKRGYGKTLAKQEEWTQDKFLSEAIRYYEMASQNGDYRASDYLGKIYEKNTSADPQESYLKALEYYDLAYQQGSDKALNSKEALLKKGY